MKINPRLLCVILLSFQAYTNLFGQVFIISKAKKSYGLNDAKLKTGDTLTVDSEFLIKSKGSLWIQHPNNWVTFFSKPGTYKLDTVISGLMHTQAYLLHDSLFNFLRINNVHKCNFRYVYYDDILKGPYATYTDDIKLDSAGNLFNRGGHIRAIKPTIKLAWTHPLKTYQGKYFILICNMFGEYLDIKVTSNNTYLLLLNSYRARDKFLLYRIISEECRESQEQLIMMEFED